MSESSELSDKVRMFIDRLPASTLKPLVVNDLLRLIAQECRKAREDFCYQAIHNLKDFDYSSKTIDKPHRVIGTAMAKNLLINQLESEPQ